MSSLIKRPPARFQVDERLTGPSNLQKYGAVDSDRSPGLYRGSSTTQLPMDHHWDDMLQVNAAHEQPKLIFNSGAAPFIRWGHRRWVRTFMTASPRFGGRWAFIGTITRAFADRGRMTGMPGRSSFARQTYTYPRFTTKPRTIALWPVNERNKPAGE